MQKVVINMDEGWRWWPVAKDKIIERKPNGDFVDHEPVIELSDAFMADFRRVANEYFELQQYLEHCYRHQQGLTPFDNSPFKK